MGDIGWNDSQSPAATGRTRFSSHGKGVMKKKHFISIYTSVAMGVMILINIVEQFCIRDENLSHLVAVVNDGEMSEAKSSEEPEHAW